MMILLFIASNPFGMNLPFEQVLSAAVTPLVLISGVGLILLSLVNRYSHAIDRTRQLYNTPKDNPELFEKRNKQVAHMYRRCSILRRSIGFLIVCVACSGLIILFSVVQLLIHVNLDMIKVFLLFTGILSLVISILLFFVDIRLSMKALDIELYRE
jgi:hypothetical protein